MSFEDSVLICDEVDPILNKILEDGIAAVASGRAEYGPRALGNRSILADPRRSDMKDIINEKVKHRNTEVQNQMDLRGENDIS